MGKNTESNGQNKKAALARSAKKSIRKKPSLRDSIVIDPDKIISLVAEKRGESEESIRNLISSWIDVAVEGDAWYIDKFKGKVTPNEFVERICQDVLAARYGDYGKDEE